MFEKLHIGPIENDLPEFSLKEYEDVKKTLPMILSKSEYKKLIEANEENMKLLYYSCIHAVN